MEKINKIIYQIKENKYIHYLIILIIGIILSIPLHSIQIRFTHDGILHLLRIIGTHNAIKINEFPPLVVPFFCNNYGYGINLFYNPIITYIPLLIKLFVPTYTIALKVFASLCIILSGITMYHFVYTVSNKKSISLFSSIAYLIVPYKLFDIYIRFAIGEFTTFVCLPILFTGIYNLFNSDGTKHYYISIGSILLILTHTITTFYTAIFCLIYVIFNIKRLKQKEIVKKLFINIIFILLITSFFTMPMLETQKMSNYVIFDNDLLCTNANFVYNNTLEIRDFFVNSKESLGEDCEKPMNFIIGIPILLFMSVTIFVYNTVNKKYKEFYIVAFIFSIISLYMSTKYFPWIILPDMFCKIQYPWRMLGLFSFFISFIVGVNFYICIKKLFNKDIFRLLISSVLIIFMLIYTFLILMQYKSTNKILDDSLENYIIENPQIKYTSINRDYMPLKAFYRINEYLSVRKDITYILQGQATIIDEEKINLKDTIELTDISKNTILEFPFLYYPGYKIILEQNGKIFQLNSIESENGFLSCIIENNFDNAQISIKYEGTLITYISYILSFISLIIFLIYIKLQGQLK